jgi:uncharacterized membrane protein
MSLESARKFGFWASLINIILPIIAIIGAVVIVISIIATAAIGAATGRVAPVIFWGFGGIIAFIVAVAAVGIVGFILFMLAMYRLANYYNEPAIFKNVLYAFIVSIISVVITFTLEFVFIFSSLAEISPSSAPSTPTPFPLFSIGYLVVIGIAVVFGIINGLLYMRAFNKLKEKSGENNFGTAAILYIIGAIVPLITWIAWIFAAMGFQKLKAAPTPTAPHYNQPPLNITPTKRCPTCGTENYLDALYCSNCGRSLQ